jgi:putative lipase involved disintegration of autophagic bodies
MSYNVYYEPQDKEWFDVGLNRTVDVSKSKDTVHAYIFSNGDLSVNVVVFKGTSVYWATRKVGSKSGSSYNDKYNDNLFFSCCFYKQSNLFNKEDCPNQEKYPKPNNIDQSVLVKQQECYGECYKASLRYELNYVGIVESVIEKVKQLVDLEQVVTFTGHSLGGALATIVGVKYGKQVVTFESPGELHYMRLSGLLKNGDSWDNIYHFGHTADIIFTGKCNGVLSWCYLGGYVIETKCHVGKVCQYDTVKYLGMSPSIFSHKIKFVIENVIEKWNDTLPECVIPECLDCDSWRYL